MPPVDPDAKIPCPTPQHLQVELDAFAAVLELGEKEETWEKLEKAVIRFAGVTRGGGYKHMPLFVEGVGRTGVGLKVAACMLSDRGRLSGVTTELLQTLAPRLGQAFAPLVTLYFDPLVRLLGRPNKVYLKRAEKCLQTIITHCHLPSILVELRRGLNDEAATCRRGCAVGFERAIKEWERGVLGIKGVERLEDALRKMATDKDPEVRQISKRVWARYNEVWPERVEDFSAPLTPTIKRYLDIRDAKNPGKAKGPVRTMAPPVAPAPHRPMPPPTSAPSSVVQPAQKPQHQRVHALVTKPARVAPHVPVAQPEAGPSRTALSPAKTTETRALHSAPTSPPIASRPQPTLIKSMSAASLPAEAFALGRHGRSVSHNILPSGSVQESALQVADPSLRPLNPLSKPSRPILPQSQSTSALLPLEASGAVGGFPSRRMAPPARILRPAPIDDAEPGWQGDVDPEMLYATPGPNGVLRGASRPDRGVGWPKRGLGKAERRVVTAPVPSLVKTPAARESLLSQHVQDGTRLDPQPQASVVSDSPAVNEPNTSPEPEQKTAVFGSPLLPVLMRSQSDVRAGREMEMIGTEDSFLAAAEVELRLAMEVPLPQEEDPEADSTPAASVQTAENVNAEVPLPAINSESPTEFPFPTISSPRTAVGSTLPDYVVTAPVTIEDHKIVSVAAQIEPLEDSAAGPSSEPSERYHEGPHKDEPVTNRTVEPVSSPISFKTASAASRPVGAAQHSSEGVVQPKPPVQRPNRTPAISLKTSTSTKPAAAPPKVDLPPPTRKPPVPKAGRVVSSEGRKPFKPTSASTATAGAKSTSSEARKNEVTAAAKAEATGTAVDKMSTTVTNHTVQAPAAPTAPPTKPMTKAPVPKPVHAKATVKPAGPTLKPPARPIQVKAQVALPPVKTEKVKRKPPLPSFRPVSKAAQGSKEVPTAKSLGASTTSIASTDRGRKEVVAKVKGVTAKVRPEAIPLPPSPGGTAKLSPARVPLPSSPIAPSSSSDQVTSPIELHPASNAVKSSPRQPSPSIALMTVVGNSGPSNNNNPSPRRHDFSSTATRFASEATTQAPTSDYLDSESDEDALQGVTFKSRLTDEPRRKVLRGDQRDREGDLMEFSAASRPKVLSGTPKIPAKVGTPGKMAGKTGTPGKMTGKAGTPSKGVEREVLGVRDANTPRKEIYSG